MADRDPAPLSGLVVVDFSTTLPGPLATKILLGLGACVVKLERPGTGDPVRSHPMFGWLNAGKLSVAADLGTDEGLGLARGIVARSDILVEGFRPRVMRRFGLDHRSLRGSLPGLIYCSINGFGVDGEMADRPGHDLSYSALAGLAGLNRDADGAIVRRPPGSRSADFGSALFAVVAILARLRERDRTGRGGLVDVPLYEAALAQALPEIAEYRLSGEERTSPWETEAATYRIYQTIDGEHVALAITPYEDRFWQRFCEAFSLESWATVGAVERLKRSALLAEELESLFAGLSLDEVSAALEGADVPWAPVRLLSTAIRDPLSGQAFGPTDVARPVSLALGHPDRDVPALGEHTASVQAVVSRGGSAAGLAAVCGRETRRYDR